MADDNSGLLFFIVDDDELIIELQKALLEMAGHRVVSTTSSADALERIPVVRPDCVISDIMMPGIDGLALLRELRQDDTLAEMRVIMVSAKSYEFDRKQSLKLGAIRSDGYSFQIETTYLTWRKGFRIREIPIIFVDRRVGVSKMNRRIVLEAILLVWRLALRSVRERALL